MPAVTRIGDADVAHCSGMTRAVGSSNVFVNSIGVSRQGDNNTTHLVTTAAHSLFGTTCCKRAVSRIVTLYLVITA